MQVAREAGAEDPVPGTENMDEAERRTQTVTTAHGPAGEGAEDVEADPALDDRVGSDWTDEGGATPSGPATSVEVPSRSEPVEPPD